MSLIKEKFETRKLPMMPIRDVVIFPFMMTPFVVGRESSVHALEEALAAGCDQIIIITGRGKSAIEDHFDKQYELEATLRKRGKSNELDLLEQEYANLRPIKDVFGEGAKLAPIPSVLH